MTRLLLPLLMLAASAHADIFLFVSNGPITVQQFPDTPGGTLYDTFAPVSSQPCLDTYCDIVVSSIQPLIPANIGGDVAYGYPDTGTLVTNDISYNATPAFYGWPSYALIANNTFFYCPPTICPTITYVTGDIQVAVEIPWFDAGGNMISADTIEFQGPAVRTPEPGYFIPILPALGLIARLKFVRRSNCGKMRIPAKPNAYSEGKPNGIPG